MNKGLHWVLPILLIVGLMTGCGANANTSDLQEQTATNALADEKGDQAATDTPATDENDQTKATVIEGDESDVKSIEVSEDGIVYSYQEISLTFPVSWENRYVLKEHEDNNGFSVLQKASNDKMEGWGFLFSVYASDTPYMDAPGAYALAYTEDKIYYFGTPTDVPFDYEDEEITRDYGLLQQDLGKIKASIVIDVPQIHTNASEYVFPMSEYYPLTEDMLLNFEENELWLARNEIYARHGYHFKNGYLQSYFERYAWYEDRGNAFSEDEFTQVEKDNVKLLKKMENEKASQNPYPLEESIGKKVFVDLSGNGTNNTVLYQLQESSNGIEKAFLTVDGVTYDMEEDFHIYMDMPEEEHFYITDISPFFDGLEIAIADYGPSDDPVTHFFVYDEKDGVQSIGSVPGFPMKQLGFQNGFVLGGVYGYSRCMTLDVHEYQVYFWYDYENRKLELQMGEESHYDLPRVHNLLADLPLHYAMDQASETFVIPVGSKVFIEQCIGENWVLVHGPNGAEGFLHYENNRSDAMFPYLDEMRMDADSAFEGLLVYD